MTIFTILIAASVIPFITGFLLQIIFEKIERSNKREKTSASKMLRLSLSLIYWRIRIKILSFLFQKEKQYEIEMKKPLNIPVLESSFEKTLMMEENNKKIEKVIEVVLQKQEKNRRKIEKPKDFFYQNFFFVNRRFMEKGPQKGIRVTSYYYNYILKNKYLKGLPLTLEEAEIAMAVFGSDEEREAVTAMYSEKIQEVEQNRKYYNYAERERFLKRQQTMLSRGENG